MENQHRNRQQKTYNNTRKVYNITMGLLIVGLGLLMFFNEQAGLDLKSRFDKEAIYVFGGLCLLYGGFRLYRGIQNQD